ncbi:DUF4870 domain-containing protein [Romboutsia hominis]|uniref:DUF4870 domain-containing protein n=1 Tax=Romboutsia hominis TaxID=1507512 RepID=UPI001F06650F|nr:DUF4870 domain-containing protein [Romboutsia hominis]MCH1959980.1 DUF4870 domain-containing protein [Romboutsia hominis]MCH1969594.1 DUF4870 domain-containing protein [Romboutsia hominis]
MDDYKKSISRENIIMLLMAGGIIVFNFIGFIISYFVWKDYSKDSDFIARNGRRLLNFHISFFIYEIISGLLVFLLIGMVLLPLVSIAYLVLNIIAMIRYGSYRDYDFPFILNIIK